MSEPVQTSARRPRKRATPKLQTYWKYQPLDTWLALPRTRVLRAFRWFPDGASAAEIFEALDLPTYDSYRNPERQNHMAAIARAVKAGELVVVGKRKAIGTVYRVAAGFDIESERPGLPKVVAYRTPLKEAR